MELYISDGLAEKKEVKRLDKRVSIHIESKRHRLADPGGISHKATIDGIVNAGILPDDSTKEIKEIRESQTKIPASEPEITIITIREV